MRPDERYTVIEREFSIQGKEYRVRIMWLPMYPKLHPTYEIQKRRSGRVRSDRKPRNGGDDWINTTLASFFPYPDDLPILIDALTDIHHQWTERKP